MQACSGTLNSSKNARLKVKNSKKIITANFAIIKASSINEKISTANIENVQWDIPKKNIAQ